MRLLLTASVALLSLCIASAPRARAGDLASLQADTRPGDPFPLAACPVSGHALDKVAAPVVEVLGEREVRFCSAACAATFQAGPDPFWKKVDADIRALEVPVYPLDTCIVSGDPLEAHGAPVDHIHNNRLVRLCGPDCLANFLQDPLTHLAALDTAIIAKETPSYPTRNCVVTGKRLGKQGVPVDAVFFNRLVRICCLPCLVDFEKRPLKFMAELDRVSVPPADGAK